jgi:hypothetical protein
MIALTSPLLYPSNAHRRGARPRRQLSNPSSPGEQKHPVVNEAAHQFGIQNPPQPRLRLTKSPQPSSQPSGSQRLRKAGANNLQRRPSSAGKNSPRPVINDSEAGPTPTSYPNTHPLDSELDMHFIPRCSGPRVSATDELFACPLCPPGNIKPSHLAMPTVKPSHIPLPLLDGAISTPFATSPSHRGKRINRSQSLYATTTYSRHWDESTPATSATTTTISFIPQANHGLNRATSDPFPVAARKAKPAAAKSVTQRVRQRATSAASDVAVQARGFRRSIYGGLAGLLIPREERVTVQRQVVRKPTIRWESIDSQYGSHETLQTRSNEALIERTATPDSYAWQPQWPCTRVAGRG